MAPYYSNHVYIKTGAPAKAADFLNLDAEDRDGVSTRTLDDGTVLAKRMHATPQELAKIAFADAVRRIAANAATVAEAEQQVLDLAYKAFDANIELLTPDEAAGLLPDIP
jgi:hypothetical protein